MNNVILIIVSCITAIATSIAAILQWRRRKEEKPLISYIELFGNNRGQVVIVNQTNTRIVLKKLFIKPRGLFKKRTEIIPELEYLMREVGNSGMTIPEAPITYIENQQHFYFTHRDLTPGVRYMLIAETSVGTYKAEMPPVKKKQNVSD